jgi:hypothetical protein
MNTITADLTITTTQGVDSTTVDLDSNLVLC